MRFALVVPGSLIVCAIAMYACSSSDETTPTVDAGKTATSSSSSSTTSSGGGGDDDDTTGDDDDNTSSSSSSGTASSSGDGGGSSSTSSTGGTTTSSSSSGSTTSSSSSGGTAVCPIKETGNIEEIEPNNAENAAQAVAGNGVFTACGVVGPGDADHFTFSYPAGSGFGWGFTSSFNGNATAAGFKVEAIYAGKTRQITNNPQGGGDDYEVQFDGPVVIKVTATSSIGYIIRFTR